MKFRAENQTLEWWTKKGVFRFFPKVWNISNIVLPVFARFDPPSYPISATARRGNLPADNPLPVFLVPAETLTYPPLHSWHQSCRSFALIMSDKKSKLWR